MRLLLPHTLTHAHNATHKLLCPHNTVYSQGLYQMNAKKKVEVPLYAVPQDVKGGKELTSLNEVAKDGQVKLGGEL